MRRIPSLVPPSRGDTTGTRRYDARQGFSLIEVIMATAILLGSVVVLGELAAMGRRQALRGAKLAEAQRLCELTLNEILIGARPLETQEQEPLRDVPQRMADMFGEGLAPQADGGFDPFATEERRASSPAALPTEPVGDAEWLHSIRIEPLEEQLGLAVLTVLVEEAADAAGRPVQFQLSRWIDDPFAADQDDSIERTQRSIVMRYTAPEP